MKKLNGFLPVLLIFSLFAGTVFAQAGSTEAFPRIVPDPRALVFHRSDASSYSWIDLAEISLWSSGDTELAQLERIRQIAAAVAETTRASPELFANDKEKAEYILEYMHRNILRTYSLTQTRVDTMLSSGRYNCVSSAVLYMILCKSIGLELSGVVTRDHAFVMLHIDGENIDVETTNPHGFDPGSRREFHDQFGRVTGFAYVPQRNYRDRQTISPIELVSLIQRNRIADYESRNLFADAVPLAVDRTALLKGELSAASTVGVSSEFFEDPHQNLLDRLFNYSAFLLRSRREEDCLRWIAFASPRHPEEKRWQELVLAAVNNRLTRFINANQLTEARAFLQSQSSVLPPADFQRFELMLIDTGLANDTNRIRSLEEGETVIAAIEEARRNQQISDARANEFLTSAVQRTASVLATGAAAGRDWLAAINYIEGAISRFGSNRELEQALFTYRGNRATDFHNRFANAFNGRNFEEAERILNEGLAEFPNDRRLLANRETMERSRP